jgi:hypothetical protein
VRPTARGFKYEERARPRPMAGADGPGTSAAGTAGRGRRFLGRHPTVLLLALTPGIPEYLSGSSSLSLLLLNPIAFLLFLAANLGLYGPGALLIREAIVRGRRSWPSLLAFGCAYATLEEGVALATFFNPRAGPVHELGSYGHYLGVSWVWVLGLLMVHTVYSIALPIVLVALALPETRGRSFLTDREIVLAGVVLTVDVVALMALTTFGLGYWMGLPLLTGGLAAVVALVLVGLAIPGGRSGIGSRWPRRSPAALALLGAAIFPVTLLVEGILESAAAPAGLAIALLAGFYGGWGALVLPSVNRPGAERERVALAGGLMAPLMVVGLVASLPLPVVAVADLAMILFLAGLWRQYRPDEDGRRRPPDGSPTGGLPGVSAASSPAATRNGPRPGARGGAASPRVRARFGGPAMGDGRGATASEPGSPAAMVGVLDPPATGGT